MRSLAPRLIVPAAAGSAIAVFARLQADREGAPETALLGLLTFIALAVLAALPQASGPLRFTALAAVAVTLALPAGPARGLAITTLLAAALGAGLLAATRRPRPGVVNTGAWVPLALGFQAIAHPRLLPAALDGGAALLALMLDWLLLPVACGAAVAALAARHGRAGAGSAGGAVFVAGGGWTWIGAAVLAALALLGIAVARRVPAIRLVRAAAALALGAVVATVIAAGYPWLSPRPARAALGALLGLAHRTEAVLQEPVVIDRERPEWRLAVEPGEARAALFDTYVTGAGDLAPGTTVAVVGVGLADGGRRLRELQAGAAAADFPRMHHLAGDGRTFVGRWRTRIELRDDGEPAQLLLDRAADAPPDLRIVLWWAGVER